jgi:hypothetical protein
MNLKKLPALVLAAVLQVLPLCRVATVNSAIAPSSFAIVMRWLAGTVALLGSYHAVSGASAAVVGVAPINPTTGLQTGLVTTNATGTNGQTFAYRVIVTNPGVNPQQAFYNVTSLPPGLTINTNLGGNGNITGTPSTPGAYPVTLIAGNANYANVVTTNITVTIVASGGVSPPAITRQPANQTLPVGTNASFTVTATGTAPLHYQWRKDGSNISGATTSDYNIASLTTNDSGNYSVAVTNSAGSITSAVAVLNVLLPSAILTPPQNATVKAGDTANFTVLAAGSPPLTYQWKFNGNNLAGATSSSLSITNAQQADQGDYSVAVSNPVGSLTSPTAHLTVQGVSSAAFELANWQVGNGSVSFDVNGPSQTNVVVWSSTDLTHWTAVSTNFSATGAIHLSETNTLPAVEFYRATLSP